jgi:hypothetical protein
LSLNDSEIEASHDMTVCWVIATENMMHMEPHLGS